MKVVMLAAGRSKRMKPIEDKNFLSFLGKPLLVHQLEILKKAGISEVILVGGKHNLEKIGAMAKSLKIKIEIVEQKNLELGMCGAVLAAKDLIKGEEVMVLSSNDVVDVKAFKLILKAAEKGGAESFIIGKKVFEYFPGGYLETDKKGFIKNIVEKPEPGTEPSDLVNLVVHIHKDANSLIKYLEKADSKKDDLYEQALAKMMRDGVKMMAVEYDGFWQPLKYPWHVHSVFTYLFSQAKKEIAKSAKIAKRATINGEVIIGENVKVFDGAVINGPCYIGDNTVIATNALVRDSNVGKNCVIGYITEVARSVLGDEVWTHSNYIGDSVIGNNVSFGAGSVTGNLRLDEKNIQVSFDGKKMDARTNKFGAIIGNNVRVGVNTSLMPGIKVGGGSFIGAGIVVPEDVADNSFVRGEWKLKISENRENIASLDRKKFKNKL
ncbi:MAG: sugar phosphate nucleotidyltransferase [Candidatus Peregrinibacteria bacterium]|nr:sugar phosphate nucleotidyltransferase [Candidatus Peregrinibacteria bacterium]